ncbi:Uncharacterized protein ALO79_00245 [Pseudomonas syringae pv. castaneae]|uniref:Uncharacterized protein n=1 Tax=Pseudomonas syringae pv. castaneae TaxID=264450 RepID=A0A0P9NMW4_PSESX|nr:Uncharacterized protein ALO79_00245 [Pseudomonas syringae pv. castaneae]
MTAVDLHTVVGGFKAHFGHEGLGNRRHERQQGVGGFLLLRVFAVLDDIDLFGREVHHGTRAFGESLHGQQHAAHVWMDDDRVSGLVRCFRAGQRTHLQTVTGILQAALEGHFGMRQTLQRSAQTRGVHEREHAVQALVRRADQVAGSAVEVHHAGGVAVDAHLVFDGATVNRVALTDAAIGSREELGHDEQRNAFGASRCVRQARQHDVDDVIGHVVFASGNENLGAGNLVGPVSLRFSPGAQHAQVSAAVGFGQAHGAGPFAGDQLGQVGVLLLGGAVLGDGVHRTMRQARVHAPRPVRFADHLAHRQTQRLGQALAAMRNVMRQTRPAALDKLLVSLLETGRCLHARLAPGAALGIAHPVQRCQNLLAELGTLFENGVDHVRGGVMTGWQTLIVRFITEQLITDETNITQGGLVVRHSDKPLLMNPGTNDRAVAESIASSTRQSRMPCGQTGV